MIDVEPLIRTHLDRLTPLPDAASRDWSDVLERAGSRHGLRGRRSIRMAGVLLTLGVIALVLFVAAPALGFRPVADVLGSEPTPSWTWPEVVPGEPIQPPEIVRDANDKRIGDRVDLSTLREIVSAGNGESSGAFLAARGLNGDVCLAKIGGAGNTMFGPFGCLHDTGPRGVSSADAVLVGMSEGGHRGSLVDYATLIGVVRSDVGRVELELVDGETIELHLNRWRGFGYSTTDSARFPKTLDVYRTWSSFFRHHQKLVGEVPLQRVENLAPTPVCGGSYGPCPPGVRP